VAATIRAQACRRWQHLSGLRHVHDLETPRLRHVHNLEVSDICASGAAMEDSASATAAKGGIDGYTGSCVGGNSVGGSIGATTSARGG
jgi:hypothetical protein